MAEAPEYLLKVILAGADKVGKSSLLLRYAQGVEIKVKAFEVNENAVKMQLWDTAGQERFQAVTQACYRGASGAILVYDITDELSFNKIGQFMDAVKEKIPNAVVMVVGNKCDREIARVVSTEEGQSFADEHGFKFMETSASDNVNVNEMVTEITAAILTKMNNR
ncbi:ras-related protein Rab-13-like isoform X2 [Dysidea avara]|uniref:ras-related protein Rab-13-like isoform X2 n=1 Tax=Dysidea avara TaxID=196820 RepID=UPI00332B7940